MICGAYESVANWRAGTIWNFNAHKTPQLAQGKHADHFKLIEVIGDFE
jgi:hypothetical protein